METGSTGLSERETSHEVYQKMYKLAIVGGMAFWATNFAISRTAIAAEYRAALSISYLPMLVESLIGGLVIGLSVSFLLLRYYDRIPTKGPILKSLVLSSAALIIVSVFLEGPARFLAPSDAVRYFLIGALFNILRILALGVTIGYVYRNWNGFGQFQLKPA